MGKKYKVTFVVEPCTTAYPGERGLAQLRRDARDASVAFCDCMQSYDHPAYTIEEIVVEVGQKDLDYPVEELGQKEGASSS